MIRIVGAACALVIVLTACESGDTKDTSDPGLLSSTSGTDADDDGWDASLDCDDDAAAVNPDATEDCGDGVDNDCDDATDADDDDC